MARQINYAAKKAKKEEEINKLTDKLQKLEATIAEATQAKKEYSKKVKIAAAELEEIKKNEIIAMLAEKNLSSEELKNMLDVESEAEESGTEAAEE